MTYGQSKLTPPKTPFWGGVKVAHGGFGTDKLLNFGKPKNNFLTPKTFLIQKKFLTPKTFLTPKIFLTPQKIALFCVRFGLVSHRFRMVYSCFGVDFKQFTRAWNILCLIYFIAY